jgi:hypothetical protein
MNEIVGEANQGEDANRNGCIQLLTSGKNKGTHCSKSIVCSKNKMCARHNNMRIANNYKKHGNYGNPDQAELWVNWVMNVGEANTSEVLESDLNTDVNGNVPT